MFCLPEGISVKRCVQIFVIERDSSLYIFTFFGGVGGAWRSLEEPGGARRSLGSDLLENVRTCKCTLKSGLLEFKH